MSYNLRTTTLSNTRLDALLAEHGAATFGSTERKRQRLQRFIDAQVDREISAARLEFARQAEQDRVRARAQARIAELLGDEEPPLKRRRITTESCPSPDSAPAPTPVRHPAPPTLPGTARMVTRSAAKTYHPRPYRTHLAEPRPAAQDALQRIRSVIAEFLA